MSSSVPMDTLKIAFLQLPFCFHLSLWVCVCVVFGGWKRSSRVCVLTKHGSICVMTAIAVNFQGQQASRDTCQAPRYARSEPGKWARCKMQPALLRCNIASVVGKKKILCSFSCQVSLIPLVLVPKGKVAFRGRREIKPMGKHGELDF